MDEFTAGNALSTGARLIRERPLLVLLWTVLILAQTVVFTAAVQEIRASAQAAFLAGRFSSAGAPQILLLTWVRLVVALVIDALMWSSAYRAILRPDDRRPLAFGREEVAVLGAWIVTQLVVGIASAALQVLLIGPSASLGWDVRIVLNAAAVISGLGLFWSAVAGAWAFERRQVAPFRCWAIARDRFWLLAGLVLCVVVLERTASAGLGQLTAAPQGSGLLGLTAPLADLFSVPALVQHALTAVLRALEIAIIAGIVANAYSASRPADHAAAFS